MGKKQHQSDKLYITNTEWREFYGGKNTTRTDSKDTSDFRRLPLDHCALSLQPYDAPYMDDEGNIFDLVHIVPYIKKYKRNPVTGKKLEPSQLVKLNIHKNSKGEMLQRRVGGQASPRRKGSTLDDLRTKYQQDTVLLDVPVVQALRREALSVRTSCGWSRDHPLGHGEGRDRQQRQARGRHRH